MSDCDVMRESMPLLLTESLDPARRELTHQHIERCARADGRRRALSRAGRGRAGVRRAP